MSRSRRKTAICSWTTAKSDKPFKQQENRRERRTVKQQIHANKEDPQLSSHKQYCNTWQSPKDGKQWIGYMKYGASNWFWIWCCIKQAPFDIAELMLEHQEKKKSEYKKLMRK